MKTFTTLALVAVAITSTAFAQRPEGRQADARTRPAESRDMTGQRPSNLPERSTDIVRRSEDAPTRQAGANRGERPAHDHVRSTAPAGGRGSRRSR